MIVSSSPTKFATVADLYERFGPMPLDRIRFDPWPGTATEEDVVRINDHEDRLCELVDGVLLEKPMGAFESYLAIQLIRLIGRFLDDHDLGIVLGEAGLLRLSPGLVRIPDVSFISWERLGDYQLQSQPIAPLAPDLAIEVISPSNIKREMNEKLDDYFKAGVSLVWYFYPLKKSVEVFTSRNQSRILSGKDPLDGGIVLPGLQIDLQALFTPPRNPRTKK